MEPEAASWAAGISSGFGARLTELRKAANLTQQQLADLAGMTKDGISQLEIGRRSPQWETVLTLAKALGVDCKAFQEQKPEPTAKPKTRTKK